jgi:hypothetical protein
MGVSRTGFPPSIANIGNKYGPYKKAVKWLWLTYAVYWSAVALAAALALAGYRLIEPEAMKRAFNETASLPYEQRLLQSALDLLVVAVASYPGLFYAAAAYGAATAAVSEAFGVGYAVLYAAVAHVVLLFFAEVARWHPLAQWLAKRRVEWGRYLLWVAASCRFWGSSRSRPGPPGTAPRCRSRI